MRVTLDPDALPMFAPGGAAAPGPAAHSAGSVVSVGVFDGVHLGHIAILETNLARARALGASATVVTFRVHPKSVLLGRAPRTLTTLAHRLELFKRSGIDHVVALDFDEALRDTPAARFVDELLVGRLGVRAFVLGFDSKFGRGREGGTEFLRARGFDVEVAPKIMLGERAVSSTAIREAVELGDLALAARMLGRPVSVFARVVHGQALGRQLGFPTANLDLMHELHPPVGVYACRVRRFARDGGGPPVGLGACVGDHPAVANIGYRPTLGGAPSPSGAAPIIEAHLLDFEGDLYGEDVELEFVRRLRGEERFEGLPELRAAIEADVRAARSVLLG
ncbi:MAG: riboflavin biosynthesis protein RibF [Planctomycetota bacterium]